MRALSRLFIECYTIPIYKNWLSHSQVLVVFFFSLKRLNLTLMCFLSESYALYQPNIYDYNYRHMTAFAQCESGRFFFDHPPPPPPPPFHRFYHLQKTKLHALTILKITETEKPQPHRNQLYDGTSKAVCLPMAKLILAVALLAFLIKIKPISHSVGAPSQL